MISVDERFDMAAAAPSFPEGWIGLISIARSETNISAMMRSISTAPFR
jgi:hypothetical protein